VWNSQAEGALVVLVAISYPYLPPVFKRKKLSSWPPHIII
jgi:hypothetical protein